MIDTSAVIDRKAQLGNGVSVGPFSVIGSDVILEDNVSVASHVVINGPTRIGKNTKIYSFAAVGCDSQDKKYKGEPAHLEVGMDNIIREYVTLSRGTEQGGSFTRIGQGNLLMAYVHIAHDCHIGDHNVFSNNASLAGHVEVGDHAILGGFVGVHQFSLIGSYSFSAGGSILLKDVLPYTMVTGYPAVVCGLNTRGLERHGFSLEVQEHLKQAYKIIFRRQLSWEEAIEVIKKELPVGVELQNMIDFLRKSPRGIIR
jgi:UDP-N-acetylglucosamine acyltransferase